MHEDGDRGGDSPLARPVAPLVAEAIAERLHNVSQHLAILRSAGVVTRRHHGREVLYRLVDPAALRVYEQIAAVLVVESARLGRLMDGRD